jgi:hypothetical protein
VGGAVALLAAAAARAAWPLLPNGDGLGYLKALVDGGVYRGHPAYLPLLRFAVGRVTAPVDALVAARLVSLIAHALAAGAVAATVLAARRERVLGAAIAGVGFALSAGALEAGADVESYAPSLAAVALTVAGLASARASTQAGPGIAVAVVAGAAAAAFHVENLLLVPVIALALPERVRPPLRLFVAGVAGALAAAPFMSIIISGDLGAATHGFRYPLRAAAPLIALYGGGKALVWAPYPYEASWARVLLLAAVGIAALAALVALATVRTGERPLLGRRATLAMVGLYAAVGIAFFASDAERWLFLLPLLWAQVGVAAVGRRAALAVGVVALLAVADVALLVPRARDRTLVDAAAAMGAGLRDGDLVISPGHGADEYVGFVERLRLERVPLVYEAARLGGDRGALRALLDERFGRARREGRRVVLLRMTEDDRDPRGWKELAHMGIDRAAARALVSAPPDLIR